MTTKQGTPTSCHLCKRHAIGIGIGQGRDPKFLCKECSLLIEQIRHIKRFDPYELRALDHAVDAVGDYIGSIGNNTDLSSYDELQRRMLCKAAVEGFGNGLRKEIEKGEAPF